MDRRQRREQVALGRAAGAYRPRRDARARSSSRPVQRLSRLERDRSPRARGHGRCGNQSRGHKSTLEKERNISGWGKDQLHRLVAAFLEVRFPTVVALNKCDRPSAKDRVAELLADGAAGDDLVPCCARVEAALVVARANGSLAYEDGAGAFEWRRSGGCGRLPDGMGHHWSPRRHLARRRRRQARPRLPGRRPRVAPGRSLARAARDLPRVPALGDRRGRLHRAQAPRRRRRLRPSRRPERGRVEAAPGKAQGPARRRHRGAQGVVEPEGRVAAAEWSCLMFRV